MKQKLELSWVDKDKRAKLEPRVLVHDPAFSFYAQTKRRGDEFDNRLIFGDNLLGLKALEREFSGKVKCVYIDPPYNTGSAFEHYDDSVEHSIWLSLMRDRLEIIRALLSEAGSLWINLDDNEVHYCKVILDEIFGRKNFLANVIWEKADSPRMDAEFFSSRHDHLLVYAREKDRFKINKGITVGEDLPEHYDKTDENGRPYYLKPLRAMGGEDSRTDRPTLYFSMKAPDGTEILPVRKDGTEGRWRWSRERVEDDKDLIEWVKGRSGWSPYYRIFGDVESKRPPETIFPHWEVGSNRTSKAEIKAIFGGAKTFATPKPERLIERIIALSTDPGDLILDSFAGSGTTGAVAHKMGRRWIMIEMGEHCHSLIIPRLKKVVDGSDQGGISHALGWGGGGGFRYYRLAPTLFKKDQWDNEVINPMFNAEMVAEAVCKLEGFNYAPSETEFWRHGQSTENDFIFVTTQTLSVEQLDRISEEVGPKRSLLVCCGAWRAKDLTRWPNLSLKKIPKDVLDKAEWDRDDYALAVSQLPVAEEEEAEANGEPHPDAAVPRKANGTQKTADGQGQLFGGEADNPKPRRGKR